MKKAKPAPAAMTWSITLRLGMAHRSASRVKVFTSPAAFDGYVSTLRSLNVPVLFTSPFIAHCKDAQ